MAHLLRASVPYLKWRTKRPAYQVLFLELRVREKGIFDKALRYEQRAHY